MRCGCTPTTCGCCEGVQILTPASIENRPGLPAIAYRAGTHGAFFETMQARLSGMSVTQTDPVSGASTTYTPLTGLTTREASDPSIALLDAWATVGDVLCFYQERIANEGYLCTATELQSVGYLADLVGYEPRPGVASSVYLAFTVDPNQKVPTDVPIGTQAQSIPGPGETSQTFETMVDFEARVEWNNVQVQTSTPQAINFQNAITVTDIYVSGTSTSLNKGDLLLLTFNAAGYLSAIRTVAQIVPDYTNSITDIQLEPAPPESVAAFPLTYQLALSLATVTDAADIESYALRQLSRMLLGEIVSLKEMVNVLTDRSVTPPDAVAAIDAFVKGAELGTIANHNVTLFATEAGIISGLLEPQNVQARSSADLQRSYKDTFAPGADVHPRLVQSFEPFLKNTLYPALAGSSFPAKATDPLLGLFAFRNQSPLFGNAAARNMTVAPDGTVTPSEVAISDTDTVKNILYLGQANDAVLANSYVYIQDDYAQSAQIQQVASARPYQRFDYGISAKTTQITLDAQITAAYPPDWNSTQITMPDIRQTMVYNQTEALSLVNVPVTDEVYGNTVILNALYDDLQSGRYVVLSGERTDIPGVTGVTASELLMVSSVVQTYDPTLPGDSLHSQLIFATDMAYVYSRSSVTINANVVLATNGATKSEILGSGSGSQSLQSFTLKQPPLTFVPAPNPEGISSTLQVFVNGVQWLEAPSLAVMGPKDHSFITQTSAGQTTVIFGNGAEGSRLPTGVQNVVAQYRSGIGSTGNVGAGQISLMQTRPLGILSVLNGADATGGADPEDIYSAKANAPMAVMALDRLVSIEDYADFSRTFAGIGKATSLKISNGQQQLIHITIAGANDIPIDPTSDLYMNLVLALEEFGQVDLPIQVDLREQLALVLSANVAIDPTYQWDLVSAQIRANLLNQYGFANMCLGESIPLSQVVGLIQSTPGVLYVNVLTFGGVPDKKTVDGSRQPLDFTDLSTAALSITTPQRWVIANLAAFDNGAIRPAQLAMFRSDIPESVILNQIS